MEPFGNMIAYFGPLGSAASPDEPAVTIFFNKTSSKSSNFLDKVNQSKLRLQNSFQIQNTLMMPWFHGDLDSNEAARLLRSSTHSTAFLVRFSAREPGCFTLSRKIQTAKGAEIQHHRIPNGQKGLTFGSTLFPTLSAFVKKATVPLQLKNAVHPSPYHHLYNMWTAKVKKREMGQGGSGNSDGIYMTVKQQANNPEEQDERLPHLSSLTKP